MFEERGMRIHESIVHENLYRTDTPHYWKADGLLTMDTAVDQTDLKPDQNIRTVLNHIITTSTFLKFAFRFSFHLWIYVRCSPCMISVGSKHLHSGLLWETDKMLKKNKNYFIFSF